MSDEINREALEPDGVSYVRNSRGQFTSSPGSGKPRRAIMREMRDALLTEIHPSEIAAMMRVQMENALDGNLKSAIFIRDTLMGKPVQAPAPDANEQKLIEIVEIMKG